MELVTLESSVLPAQMLDPKELANSASTARLKLSIPTSIHAKQAH